MTEDQSFHIESIRLLDLEMTRIGKNIRATGRALDRATKKYYDLKRARFEHELEFKRKGGEDDQLYKLN